MYDSITVADIPADAPAVAGYVGGHWPTYNEIVVRFPHAHHLSIAVTASQHARCLDCEPGDASPAQAPSWFINHADRTQGRPVLYGSASAVNQIVQAMSHAGIARAEYLIWSAHYTFREHVCSPSTCGYPQADGTQWTDKSHGRNLDQSICEDYFFSAGSPAPTPPLPKDTMAIAGYVNENGHSEIVVHLESGEVKNLYKVEGKQAGAPGWKQNKDGSYAWETLGKPGK